MATTRLQTSFFDQLRTCTHSALLLDYDGTLAPFSANRDQAEPYPKVVEALRQILDTTATRIIFITGRRARDLARLLRPHGLNCEIWGIHGGERLLADGTCRTFTIDEHIKRILQQADALLRLEGLTAVEVKPLSRVVHWRGLDPESLKEIQSAARRAFAAFRGEANCRLLEFDGGIELLAGKRDKGDAVRTILGELQNIPVAYLGDDLTDEDAFMALGDAGLTVLVRPELRPTSAQLWIRPPHELIDFLAKWADSCGGVQ